MSECARHPPAPLYLPAFERDACGLALVASPRGVARHDLVVEALTALARLAHRGGGAHTDAPPDGAGLLVQIPWALLESERCLAGAPDPDRRALATFFLPRGAGSDIVARLDAATRAWGWRLVSWREVPIDPTALPPGGAAPDIAQALFRDEGGDASRRRLWLARLAAERLAADIGPEAAVVSMSATTVVYKGLVRPADLGRFYPDLTDLRTKTA
ncbi:MAG: glutamate synthase subunit alpha, partial [Vicinamibacteraceae bacterium]|nr:glutamate synthase subunit alpha [Vicinamibacteraceae bacterium]